MLSLDYLAIDSSSFFFSSAMIWYTLCLLIKLFCNFCFYSSESFWKNVKLSFFDFYLYFYNSKLCLKASSEAKIFEIFLFRAVMPTHYSWNLLNSSSRYLLSSSTFFCSSSAYFFFAKMFLMPCILTFLNFYDLLNISSSLSLELLIFSFFNCNSYCFSINWFELPIDKFYRFYTFVNVRGRILIL